MKNLFLALLMAIGLFSCSAFKTAPKGDLTYCSYTKAGGGSLGKDYCELIADVDSVPKIVVVLNERLVY